MQPQTTYGYNAWGCDTFAGRLGLGGYDPGMTTSATLWPESAYTTRSRCVIAAIVSPARLIALGDGFNRSTTADLDAAPGLAGTIAPFVDLIHGTSTMSLIPFKQGKSFQAHHGRANRASTTGTFHRKICERGSATMKGSPFSTSCSVHQGPLEPSDSPRPNIVGFPGLADEPA